MKNEKLIVTKTWIEYCWLKNNWDRLNLNYYAELADTDQRAT